MAKMTAVPDWAIAMRRLRVRQNLTLNQVALAAGASISTIARWESGEAKPRVTQLQQLAGNLGIDIKEIVKELGGLELKGVTIESAIEPQKSAPNRIIDRIEAINLGRDIQPQDLDPLLEAMFAVECRSGQVLFELLKVAVTIPQPLSAETLRLLAQDLACAKSGE